MFNWFNAKKNTMPKQVFVNTKDIKELKETVEPVYSTNSAVEPNTTTIALNLTDATSDTTGGYLITGNSNLFKIVANADEVLYIKFLCDLKGSAGETGATGATGVGISSITSGSASVGDEETTTPVTVTLTNSTSQTFNVKAKNGEQGATGQTGVGIEKIESAGYADGDDFTITHIDVTLTNGSVEHFDVQAQRGATGATGPTGPTGPTGQSIDRITTDAIEPGDIFTVTTLNVEMSDGDIKTFRVNAKNGSKGTSVVSTKSGTPTISDTTSTTPVTVYLSDGSTTSFDVTVQNGGGVSLYNHYIHIILNDAGNDRSFNFTLFCVSSNDSPVNTIEALLSKYFNKTMYLPVSGYVKTSSASYPIMSGIATKEYLVVYYYTPDKILQSLIISPETVDIEIYDQTTPVYL